MLTKKLLKEEVYKIKVDKKTILYAPLTRKFLVYNGAVEVEQAEPEWLRSATSISRVPLFVREGMAINTNKIRLRLNVTTRCNLNCGYCSVRAGENTKNMSETVAFQSIDGFSRIAMKRNAQNLELVFSGGEPTLRIPLIKQCIDRAKQKLDGSRVTLRSRILTNGLFELNEYFGIAKEITEIQISWDGFFGSSYRYGNSNYLAKRVWDNIGFLVDKEVLFSVLIVVSEENFFHITEIVDQLYDKGVRRIFLALKENIGRALKHSKSLDFEKLGTSYFGLWKKYRKIGMDINLTGTDIHSVSPFPCSVPIPNYSVSPSGRISACTISFNEISPHAKIFEIGNVSNGRICIRDTSIGNLAKFHVLNIPRCSDCYAKWHCRGGCIYAKGGKWFEPMSTERCKMVREIVARKLLFAISERW